MQKRADGNLGDIVSFYGAADEKGRLLTGLGPLEFARTKEILQRHLAPPPAVILDVGGATGRYSLWLAKEGYEVHLIDPVPGHIEEARQASFDQPETPIKSISLGDARRLEFADGTADAVLMFGPLYHLTRIEDRLQALREADRVLRIGGLIFAVGISRFASSLEGLVNGHIANDEFVSIIVQDLKDGQHRNPTGNLTYFTDAHFHRPEELRGEVEDAGFAPVALLMIDPFAYHLEGFFRNWSDASKREQMLDILRKIESEPSLMGAGPHLMCVGRKTA